MPGRKQERGQFPVKELVSPRKTVRDSQIMAISDSGSNKQIKQVETEKSVLQKRILQHAFYAYFSFLPVRSR